MPPRIAFCRRCRGMAVGWNKRYISHSLLCKQWLRKFSRLGGLAIVTGALLLSFPQPNASVFSGNKPESQLQQMNLPASTSDSPAARSMDAFLRDHGVREANRNRLAESILTSAR